LATVVPAREEVVEVVKFEDGTGFYGAAVGCALSERGDTVVPEETRGGVDATYGDESVSFSRCWEG
jgi:hypothetical protein